MKSTWLQSDAPLVTARCEAVHERRPADRQLVVVLAIADSIDRGIFS
jgi:hypothetical protein